MDVNWTRNVSIHGESTLMGKVCKTKNQQRLCVGRRHKCNRDDMHCNDMRAHVHTDFATTPGRPFEQAILPHMMAATICADGIYFRRRNHLRWKQRICNVCCLRCRTQVLQIPLKLGAYRLSFLEPSDRARKASKVPTLH